ncbi:hypothetical protein [Phenylobacterium sp. NIBR 498073]|uniref:hypothetical protein n=1 Tax=Phenylobacterium sp. NIBR 498073 TaxID=3015177 RepID=UPI0022B3BA1E|nr:hypothetical protein [Phenylobacterium sp. NIBR 498073]WGU42033.1 hypothetical protein O4N75_09935 [Phenylobacterium sp. NIBR 498073]
MRLVALIAVVGLLAAGTASAQSGQVRNDAKSSGMLMAATYKTTPARTATGNTVRFTAKPIAANGAKPQVYIYKAPMAVKPLKTW